MKNAYRYILSSALLLFSVPSIGSEYAGEDISGTLCSILNTPSGEGARWSIKLRDFENDTSEVVFGVTKNRKIQSVACRSVSEPMIFSMRETQTEDYEIYDYDPNSEDPLTQLTDNSTDDVDVTMSSDGKVIAYQSRLADGRQAIVLSQADEDWKYTKRSLASASPFVQPMLSANGKWLVFVQLRPSYFAVMRYDITQETYTEVRKVPRRKKLYHPSISNDGNIVGWTENKSQNRYLIKNLEEGVVTQILNDADGIEHGTLSSDGKMLSYSINGESSRQIFIANLDTLETSQVGEVFASPDRYLGLAWQGGVIAPINDGDITTTGVECAYSYSAFNNSASVDADSTSNWSCTDGSRVLSANGIPDHDVGTFPNPGNPNTISEQTVEATYTLTPTPSDAVTELGGPRGPQGYVLNGVKIDASTAGSCDDSGESCSLIDNSGSWSIEALGQSSFDFGTDDNNAHVQPGGVYHYHGMPEGFVTKQGGNSSTMTLIGWAADGFPIYARYGYSVASDMTSSLKVMTGSYQHVSDTSDTRPSTDTYPLGAFRQDWEYVEGSGDLDECNGRTGVTPEFPNGIYHYYATDSYPYFQRCVKGEVETIGGPGGPGGPVTGPPGPSNPSGGPDF